MIQRFSEKDLYFYCNFCGNKNKITRKRRRFCDETHKSLFYEKLYYRDGKKWDPMKRLIR
jgi:hypothetical protein